MKVRTETSIYFIQFDSRPDTHTYTAFLKSLSSNRRQWLEQNASKQGAIGVLTSRLLGGFRIFMNTATGTAYLSLSIFTTSDYRGGQTWNMDFDIGTFHTALSAASHFPPFTAIVARGPYACFFGTFGMLFSFTFNRCSAFLAGRKLRSTWRNVFSLIES